MNNLPIGVFDSGIGGLTVVKEIMRELPHESIMYLGDTARVPYGTRGKEVITKFALELARFLLKQKVKALVVACNTMSAICLDRIARISPVPVIGVIKPTIKEAIKRTKTHIIGIIGTRATIGSQTYEKEIKRLDKNAKVITQACPLFVPLVEEGLINHQATRLITKNYLKVFKKQKIDTLILGCTHYPLLLNIIQETIGPKVIIIDSAKPTARFLHETLRKKNLFNKNHQIKHRFLVTDAPDRLYQIVNLFFDNKFPGELKKVEI